MSKTDINWDGTKIRVRPSSLNTFVSCPFQWAKVYLEGARTIPGARAAIGTAVHKGVEELWGEAKLTGSKDVNMAMIRDAAVENYTQADNEDDLFYDGSEDINTSHDTVIAGVDTFVEDILPFTDIPDKVEHFITMPIDHSVVYELGGTIDYLNGTTMADVKTSKRKPSASGHVLQQTIYKLLAEYEGRATDLEITTSLIQGVAFTKVPMGHIIELTPDVPKTKFTFNSLLDTLEAYESGVDPKLLFRGNPSHFLCSNKYCTLYESACPYVNGEA